MVNYFKYLQFIVVLINAHAKIEASISANKQNQTSVSRKDEYVSFTTWIV